MNGRPIHTDDLSLQAIAWRFSIYSCMKEAGYNCTWMHFLPGDEEGLLSYTFGYACDPFHEERTPEDTERFRHHHRAFHLALKLCESVRPWYVVLSPYAMQVVLGQIQIDPKEVQRCSWQRRRCR